MTKWIGYPLVFTAGLILGGAFVAFSFVFSILTNTR